MATTAEGRTVYDGYVRDADNVPHRTGTRTYANGDDYEGVNPVPSSLLKKYCSQFFHDFPTHVQGLDHWSRYLIPDESASVATNATLQISGTCSCFAAVRSFNHR
jgi:hypothetical protein